MTIVLLALAFFLLSAVPAIRTMVGGDTRAFILDTLFVSAAIAAIVAGWPPGRATVCARQTRESRPPRWPAAVIGAVGLAVLAYACRTWLGEILRYPIDAQRADMLVVVESGIRRLLHGRNPYVIYHVPWEAPLPYGPVLWAPFISPALLHADLRFVTVGGALFVPAACVLAAVAEAWNRGWRAAVQLLVLAAAIATSAELAHFISIGHTPSYWPLIAAFAWLCARRSWHLAAVALGLLIAARTTMVSLAPVFVMGVWLDDRRRAGASAALLIVCAVAPFVPFLLIDWRAIAYALFGSYQTVMKGFVWASTSWVQHTIGVTGMLLAAGLQRLVEPVQAASLACVYIAAWRALRRGAAPLAWMGAALFVFSLTTLWPVGYIYFDVVLLLIASALAGSRFVSQSRRVWMPWTAAGSLALAMLAVASILKIPRRPVVNIGAPGSRDALYRGFADVEYGASGGFAWIDGRDATVLVPRRVRAAATIEIECQPFTAAGPAQDVAAVLNGMPLGSLRARPGWQRLSFDAPARAWQIGVNRLQIVLRFAAEPGDPALAGDPRRLSLAVSRIAVR